MTAFILSPDNARERMAAAWDFAKRFLELGRAASVTVEEFKQTRTKEQNDKFHAICQDISKQRPWAGVWLDEEGWKRLFIDAWARMEGRAQCRVVPSLDGLSVVSIGIQSRRTTPAEMDEIITLAESWAVDNGVRLNEPRKAA